MMVTDEDFVFRGLLDTQPAFESRMGHDLTAKGNQRLFQPKAQKCQIIETSNSETGELRFTNTKE
jgi:hypothetical protein